MTTKSIKIKIKEYFFLNPNLKLRVRGIERNLKLPLPSVIRYCKELKEENILNIEAIDNIRFYVANKTNKEYILQKRLYNLNKLISSGLIEFLKIELSNPVIILFGSYFRGEDDEKSDIDLYIKTKTKKNIDIKKFEKKLNRKIQIIWDKNLKKMSPFLANNIINGITLNNHIEVF